MPPRAAALLLSSALAVMESHSFGSVTPVISVLCELCFLGLIARLAGLAQGQKKGGVTLYTSEMCLKSLEVVMVKIDLFCLPLVINR